MRSTVFLGYETAGIVILQLWRGRKILRYLNKRLLDTISPDLLFYVISHERSGTHFLINTIRGNTYVRQGWHVIHEWFGPYDEPANRFAHIDAFNATWEQAYREGAIIKSHCDRLLFDARYKRAKTIYVLRDPRDTLTSWFHYLNSDTFHRCNSQVGDHRCQSFSEFLRRPVSPWLRYGYSLCGDFSNVVERWASHVSGWLTMPDVLIVRYGDLKRDYKAVLERVSDFVGLRLRVRARPVSLHDAPSVLPRKGIIGDWKSLFTQADETFLQRVVERAGIDWFEVIDRDC
jgi:hypothetical protein